MTKVKNFRLLTKIKMIQTGSPIPINLNCFALVLQFPISHGNEPSKNGQIRGFLSDGAFPVFTLELKCGPFEYEVMRASNPNMVMMTDSGTKPLFTGHILRFKDGTSLSLIAENSNAGLQIDGYDEITTVWKNLPQKVLQHWTAPSFPVICTLPRGTAADYLKRSAK